MKKLSLLLLAMSLLIASCGERKQSATTDNSYEPLEVKYAKGFSLDQTDKYIRITIHNTFNQENEFQQRLYLVKSTEIETPSDGQKIVVPIKTLAIASVTNIGYLRLIDELQSVKGACTPNLIYDSSLKSRFHSGEIKDLGDEFSPNIEGLLQLHPDAYMIPSYDGQDERLKYLKNAGVRFVFNNDWLEPTPLGRVEWIKFVAALYDKLPLADSIFSAIEQRYEANKLLVKDIKEENKPKVLMNTSFKGTWYMPAGNSYGGAFLKDAGANYVYKDKNIMQGANLSYSFESVLAENHDADIWLNAYSSSKKELLAMDERHGLFKAFKNGEVYSYKKSGDDYFETGVIEPDVLLKDIIKTLYPTLLPDYETKYVEKCR